MICWFEDRASGTRLALEGFIERISIDRADAVQAGLKRIEQAQAAGNWVALVIEYEFGLWLEPALQDDIERAPPARHERLAALVFERARTAPIDVRTDINQTDPGAITEACPDIKRSDYILMIEEIRSLIAAGEVYQINATFPLKVKTVGSPLDLYQRLAFSSHARYCAYIEDPQRGRTILSLSPELFVRKEGNRLTTRPMKGTAPRVPADSVADRLMGERLRGSVKDRAENLMIVDLLRNDLGRLAVTGSVRVDPLFELEAYPSVWTLTSTISATLKSEYTLSDILRALFPCGSITGAPKIAAMRHIKRLERSPRGVYCGSLGWLAPDGQISLNVAIRTLVIDESAKGTYGVGGGIVYDSVANNEWQECFWKARILGIDCEPRTD